MKSLMPYLSPSILAYFFKKKKCFFDKLLKTETCKHWLLLLIFQDKLLTESDRGSWYFLKALYKTADKCVECSLTECQLSPGGEKFLAFAKSALFSATGEASSLVCAESGKPVGNGHGPGAKAIDLFANSNNDGGGKATTTIGDEVSEVPVAEEATGNAANSIALFVSPPVLIFSLALFCLF